VQTFFQSLSLTSASVLTAVASSLAALIIGRIGSVVTRWCLAVLLPFAFSYSVYWMPVWLGSSDVAQYHAWQPLGVGVPFLAGLMASAVVTFSVVRHARKHVQPSAKIGDTINH
jgi:hypothetical protein